MARRLLVQSFLVAFALVVPTVVTAQETTVILVRHAEKVDGTGDVALTDAGKARAARLVELLRHAGITAIYSTPYVRTKDTGRPLAEVLGLELILTPVGEASSFPSRMAQQILNDHKGRTVLVVGHSNTTPDVVRALGAPAIPPIADGDYDNLYIVKVDGHGKATLIRAKL